MTADQNEGPAPPHDEPDESVAMPERRLADKVKAAMSHAMLHGRDAVAERLKLCHDAILDEEADFDADRRSRDE